MTAISDSVFATVVWDGNDQREPLLVAVVFTYYPLKVWLLLVLIVLVAWDDALQHPFDIWTPFDQLQHVDGYA